MQKLLYCFVPILYLFLFFVSSSWAIDYSLLSTQDLYEFKGAMKNAPESEQKAYEIEWQKRLEILSEEEKKLYLDGGAAQGGLQGKGKEDGLEKPFIPGRGYDIQGTGGILYGGGSPVQDGK